MTGFFKHKAALFVVGAMVAAPLAGCSSGGDDDAKSDDASTTTTTIVVPDNFFEDPLKAEAIVDRLVDEATPIIGLSFKQDAISIQERGRSETFVVYEEVGPDDFGPTTTEADPDTDTEGTEPAQSTERGVTVQRSEMTPEEYGALTAELAAIDERNAGVVSDEGVAPIASASGLEPYRFGPERVDAWGYDGNTKVAVRSPSSIDTETIESLDERTFFTSAIDWTAFAPLMRALLDELDLGDTEKVVSVGISRKPQGSPADIVVSMKAEGERGTGHLTVADGQVSITRS